MRVRFAPSPTGALHIGGARTALYNWLAARHEGAGATLLLRIEDTDRERSTQENVEQILDALRWLDIDYDEGPVFQTHNEPRHRAVIEQLLADGHAYRSTATAETVKAYKAQHGADRGFRGEAEPEGAVRLRVPDDGATVVRDIVRGETAFQHVHLDDPVIARADGSPLYNLAVAVDDLDAGITHVVRGDDHYSNTPKQLLVLEALGAPQPIYCHLPLLHGPDGKKLSKRHGAASVQELRDAGYLPAAVRNYLALLGWGTGDDTTVMATEELVARFRVEDVGKSAAIFDERKLRWLNGRFMREMTLADYTAAVARHLEREPDERLRAACAIAQEKAQTLEEVWGLIRFLFEPPVEDGKAWEKVMKDGALAALEAAHGALLEAPAFDADAVETALSPLPQRLGAKPGKVYQPIRVAITGTTVSPGIFESLAALGREESLVRIDAAVKRLQS
jgi:glutamyl-tRNA synthetase